MWEKLIIGLPELNQFRIPRKVISSVDQGSMFEIHGFADASIKAYGACVYIRTINSTQEISVKLLCAKSHVAPLKTVSLPRLELNAAVLLVELVVKVSQILNIPIQKRFLWTDSSIVLSWIAESPHNWKQYIANRVAKIQSHTSYEEWNHVRSNDNPADVVSRGAFPEQLRTSKLWWFGPQWLTTSSQHWPETQFQPRSDLVEERRPQVINLIKTESEYQYLQNILRFTNYSE